jgi:hypothetical protein
MLLRHVGWPALLWLTCAPLPAQTDAAARPVVGAIRWDAWTAGSEWERNLGPAQWRSRLPFYGTETGPDAVEIRADTQAVMDREIAYASAAGLDYWAYCFHLPTDLTQEPDEYALRLHLASAHKADVHFCFILMGPAWWGPAAEYGRAAERLAHYFADPAYQRVEGDRPLLYVYYTENLAKHFGGAPQARAALDLIREKAVAAGLGPPLIVAQVWHADEGARLVDSLGFDAVSAYAMVDLAHWADQEFPYSNLAAGDLAYWESCRATGKQVIPLVSAGWDNRPRWRDAKRYEELYKSKPRGPWYVQPTPAELAANLRSALDWLKANPSLAEPQAVLIYAWNESDEGGWLVPTHAEGTARLDALREVLAAR